MAVFNSEELSQIQAGSDMIRRKRELVAKTTKEIRGELPESEFAFYKTLVLAEECLNSVKPLQASTRWESAEFVKLQGLTFLNTTKENTTTGQYIAQ